MGRLERVGAPGPSLQLDATYLEVGRGPECALVIDHEAISRKHAAIYWGRSGWMLKDLSSRNGTELVTGDGVPLRVVAPEPLRRGDVVRFGTGAHTWELVSDLRPPAVATCVQTGESIVEGTEREGLRLGGPPPVRVSLREDAWWRLDGPAPRDLADGAVVEVGARAWRLHLPLPFVETKLTRPRELTFALLDDAVLHLVWRHEELVDAFVVVAGQSVDLPRRRSLRLLWILVEAGGWVEQEDVLARLGLTEGGLHTYVFQLKGMFLDALRGTPENGFVRRERGRLRLARR